MSRILGWLLGLGEVSQIDAIDPSLAAPWAQEGPFWVFLGVAIAGVLAAVFYFRAQPKVNAPARVALAISRGVLLALLLLTLADPVLQISLVNRRPRTLFVIFDGTDSMGIADQWSSSQKAALSEAAGLTAPKAATPSPQEPNAESPEAAPSAEPSRIDYVRAFVAREKDNLLSQLETKHELHIEPFVFDGNTTSQLRKLTRSASGAALDPQHVAEQLSSRGQVTALGAVVNEISQQLGSNRLAGVVVFSDFAHNAGVAPIGAGESGPLARLDAPVYAVGLGAVEAVDLAVDVQTDPKMKKAERSSVLVKLRQAGMTGRSVTVDVFARKIGDAGGPEIKVGQRTVALASAVETVELPFTPDDSGKFEFTVTVEPQEGEIVEQNNRSVRQVNIIDDYLRLMYVAHEPTWEWRFIKEVFHRDKLVGMQGFRTFLGSSDPRVREQNVLFLPTLTPKRSEFFASDVIFLDDMPRGALTDRFCEMAKEYVGNLGGGLVVIAGPRFGPQELYSTPLVDLLPVIVDPQAERREAPEFPEFRPRLTPHAARYPFMQLGENEIENQKAWDNLGRLPWYQPVSALHEQAFALAEHPTDRCRDGKTPQPLIAVRQYGKGEVVYLAFNETWRLRKIYGEKYYRQFWSQLIYRLGISHALGEDKRFVARIDQQQYRAEDKVTLTIEAYDENFEPLGDENLPDRGLTAELVIPAPGGGELRQIRVPMLRKGVFEARIPVAAVGQYSLRVKDPVSSKFDEQRFEVTPLSAERRRGVRDEKLQQEIAQRTGGKAYELTTADKLLTDIRAEPVVERLTRNQPLWSTPLWFITLTCLMLGEWLVRKWLRLS